MAEINPQERQAIVDVLAPVFSSKRGKDFALPGNHGALEEEHSCDIVLRAPDGELAKFEHTRTKGNVELERIRPKHASRVFDLLQAAFKSAGLKGAVVFLTLDPPPARPADQETVAWWIAGFIARKVREGRLTYFSFDVVKDWTRLRFVEKYVKQIVINPGDPDHDIAIAMSHSRIGYLIDSVGDFRDALDRKARRYGKAASGKMLVVEFESWPLDNLDLPEVKEVGKQVSHAFDEVWAVHLRYGNACWRIWPPDVSEIEQGKP